MLIINRKRGQAVILETPVGVIRIVVSGRVSLGIEAPDCVVVLREELCEKIVVESA